MAKTVLLGKDKEQKLKEQKKVAKLKNKKKRKSIARYFKDIYVEMKKVTWPTPKDLLNYTVAVVVFILIMAIITGAFDMGLTQLFDLVVG